MVQQVTSYIMRLLVTPWLVASLALWPVAGMQPAYANPQDGQVASGSATITETGKKLDVHQSSDKVVIDWRSFDIEIDEHTQFHQPGSGSIALNRVNSNDPSRIMGALSANGNVIIVNPNGVAFGKDSRVDVNGLVATTADIDNQKFMNGQMHFDKAGDPNASIVNEGQITAGEAGLVGLVAPNVVNSGVIKARMGRVQLSSGDTMTADFYGDGLMEVAVSDDVKSQVVSNSGRIEAEGGTIALTAAAGRNIVNSLITVKGELKAPAVGTRNGKIVIYAEGSNAVKNNVAADKGKKTGSSTVMVQGKVDASGKNAGEKGGTIEILADNVNVKSGTVIDASGDIGGGKIYIGGDYLGSGNTPNALNTYVGSNVTISSDALTNGSGGKVIVWADNNTWFYGDIFARGGAISGDGGFVETSGKENLSMQGMAHVSAFNGKGGTWLLDPRNVTITSSGADVTTDCGSSPYICTATSDSWTILASSISAALTAGTNVTITTGSTGSQNGDITVSSAIAKTGGGDATLKLEAAGSIFVNAAITSNTNKLHVTLNSNTDDGAVGATGGKIQVNNTTITSNGGNIKLVGGSNGNDYAMGLATAISQGVLVDGSTINAGGGNILIKGQGGTSTFAGGVVIGYNTLGTVQTSGTGTIDIYGIGGNGTGNSHAGIYLAAGGVVSTTGTGAVYVFGQGGANNDLNHGIYMQSGAKIESTSSGDITIEAVKVAGASSYALRANTATAATLGGDSYSGTLKLIMDSILMDGTSSHKVKTSGDLILQSRSNGADGLHWSNSPGTNFLDFLTWGGTLSIGNTNAASMTISNAATYGASAFLNRGSVKFISGGDITLGTNLAKTTSGTSSITLQAGGNISTAGYDITSNSGAWNIVLQSNYDDTGTGYINLASGTLLTSNGGNITLGGGSNIATGYALGSNTSGTQYGIYVNGTTINAGGGTVTMRGQGGTYGSGSNYGIYLYNGSTVTGNNGSGAISLTGVAGSGGSGNYGFYAGTGTNTIGSGTYSGNLTINTDTLSFANTLALNTTGTVSFTQLTNSTNVNVLGGSGGLEITSGLLDSISNASGVIVGRTDGANSVTIHGSRTWSRAATFYAGTGGLAIDGAQTMGSNAFLGRTTGSISLGSGGSINSAASGNAIVLAADVDFTSTSSLAGSALSVTGGGRWLIYSTKASQNAYNGLLQNFVKRSSTYSSAPPGGIAESGNGFIYSEAATILTVTIASVARYYGDDNPSFTYDITGWDPGDDISLLTTGPTLSTVATAASDVGSYSITGSGAVAGDYDFNYIAGTLTINKAVLTATMQALGQTYGDTLTASDKTDTARVQFSGLKNSQDASVLDSVTFSYGGATTSAVNNAGTYTLGISAFSDTNYSLNIAGGAVTTANLVIGKKALTATMQALGQTYGDTLSASDQTDTARVQFAGFITGEDATNLGGSATTFSYGGATTSAVNNAGTYTLGISAFSDTNYSLDTGAGVTTANLTIGKKALTATMQALGQTYGDTLSASDQTDTARVQFAGFITGEDATDLGGSATTFSYGGATTSAVNNAGTYTLGISAFSDTNYSLNIAGGAVTTANLVIGKKALTATMQALGQTYGDTLSASDQTDTARVQFTGFITGEDATDLGGSATTFSYGGATTSAVNNAGTYTLGISAFSDTNYSLNIAGGAVTTANLVIGKKALTATMQALGQTYGDTLTASGQTDTSRVQFVGFITGEDATDLGGSATTFSYGGATTSAVNNAGTYTLGISAFSDTNYSLDTGAGVTTASLIVGKKTLTATAANQTITYGTSAPGTTTISYSGLVNSDLIGDVVSVDPGVASAQSGVVNAGTYTGNYTLSGGTISSNYQLSYVAGDLIVNKKALTATMQALGQTYGDTLSASDQTDTARVQFAGFITGEDATNLGGSATTFSYGGATTSAVNNAGTYTLGISAFSDTNYSLDTGAGVTTANLTIGKKALTAAVGDKTLTYGDTTPALTNADVSYSGFVTGQNSSNLASNAATFTYGGATVGAVNNANPTTGYTLGMSAFNDTNYSVDVSTAVTNGKLYINKKALTATMQALGQTYGDTLSASSQTDTARVQFAGFITGEDATDLGGSATTFSYGGATAGGINNAGTYALGISAFSDSNYSLNTSTGVTGANLTVGKKALAATIGDKTITYGDTTPALTNADVSYSGFISGENASNLASNAATFTYGGATAGAIDNANPTTGYTLGMSAFNDNNYSVNVGSAVTNGKLYIDKKAITASFASALAKTYGDANPTLTYANFNFTGLVGSDSASEFTSITPNYGAVDVNTNVGAYAASAAIGATSNYTVSNTPSTTLTINARALTVATDAKSKLVSEMDPAFTGAASGLTAHDAALISWAYAPASYSGLVGTYTIGATATDSSSRLANYTRTNSYGLLTVTALPPVTQVVLPVTVQYNSQRPIDVSTASSSTMMSSAPSVPFPMFRFDLPEDQNNERDKKAVSSNQ